MTFSCTYRSNLSLSRCTVHQRWHLVHPLWTVSCCCCCCSSYLSLSLSFMLKETSLACLFIFSPTLFCIQRQRHPRCPSLYAHEQTDRHWHCKCNPINFFRLFAFLSFKIKLNTYLLSQILYSQTPDASRTSGRFKQIVIGWTAPSSFIFSVSDWSIEFVTRDCDSLPLLPSTSSVMFSLLA